MSKKSAKPVSSEKSQNSASNYLAKPAIRLGHDVDYDGELARLQIELVKLQEWIRHKGLRVDQARTGAQLQRIFFISRPTLRYPCLKLSGNAPGTCQNSFHPHH